LSGVDDDDDRLPVQCIPDGKSQSQQGQGNQGGGYQSQNNYQQQQGNTQSYSRDMKTITCFKCGEVGHYANACTVKRRRIDE
jgi:hypothetical protein